MRIGVFDSGVGGITVLRELRRRLPACDYVYLGDTAHVPYGGKSLAQVKLLSAECAERLIAKGIDAIVVACNTASSLALPAIRAVVGDVPVFGVVEPGVEAILAAAVPASRREGLSPEALSPETLSPETLSPETLSRFLILATRATVASGAYGLALRARLPAGAEVIEQACPLLVPMIEEGWIDHPILGFALDEYVGAHRAKPGVALLACTHYPWIRAAVARALPAWTIVNSAEAVAAAVAASLPEALGSSSRAGHTGTIEWCFTDPEAVPAFARAELSRV